MSAADLGAAWAGQTVTSQHAVVPGEKTRQLTGTVQRGFTIGRTGYLVIRRADGVEGTAAVRSVVPT